MQILPSQSSPNRHKNLPDVLRPLETIWIMEKDSKPTLLLLQHPLKVDRWCRFECPWKLEEALEHLVGIENFRKNKGM